MRSCPAQRYCVTGGRFTKRVRTFWALSLCATHSWGKKSNCAAPCFAAVVEGSVERVAAVFRPRDIRHVCTAVKVVKVMEADHPCAKGLTIHVTQR